MKEIKLTDRSDITFNPLLIFSVLQLSGSSGDDQINGEGLGSCSAQRPNNNINNSKSSMEIITLGQRAGPPTASISQDTEAPLPEVQRTCTSA